MTDQNSTPADSQDGTDTPVKEWFGQSVESDTELADELVEEHGEAEAEKMFDEQATGEDVEEARRGDSIDPELGESSYQDDTPDHVADQKRSD